MDEAYHDGDKGDSNYATIAIPICHRRICIEGFTVLMNTGSGSVWIFLHQI
jgi:hypothetical protein